MYLSSNFRVKEEYVNKQYWGRTQALQPSPHNLTQLGLDHHSLRLLVPISISP